MNWMRTTTFTLTCFAASLCAIYLPAQDGGTEFFENKIRPVLVAQCYKCHSAEADAKGKLKGGLFVDSKDGLLQGGDSGPAIVPKNIKKSLLLSALKHQDFEMPPSGKLPSNVVADFTRWIQMGAPDPRSGKSATAKTAIDLEAGRQFWSFQPVANPKPPKSKADDWSRTEIDQFVFAKQSEGNVTPVKDADAQSLLRRTFYDLIGLPPTLEEQQLWLDRLSKGREAGVDQKAFSQLVDHLLGREQFGERWGRHWLDVARYAESNGNTRNAIFPHAWRYRDYVIDALNADTPYDQFITEQIAGDLLPSDSAEETNRRLVATGFLALGSKPVIRGKSGGFVPDIAADQIEVTTRSVLGLTVACARCHDHKFDPIPTTDYYALAGIFASSQTLYGGGSGNMGGAPATPLHVLQSKDKTEVDAFAKWKQQVRELQTQQKAASAAVKKLRPKKGKAGQPARKLTPEQKAKVDEAFANLKALSKRYQQLKNSPPAEPAAAMGVRDLGKVTEVPVYIRGESPKGDRIPRGFVSVASHEEVSMPTNASGRLELAAWLTGYSNPLTARVMVNRVWTHLFGEGIVRTPDNFGFNGQRPTHPQLLDWLAGSFAKNGWSTKQLIRQIMLSRTYQLSSAHQNQNYQTDPDNIYLWRHNRRRLEGEAIRDGLLLASGELDLDRPTGSAVSKHGGKLIQDSLTPDKIHVASNHRSVYLPMMRNGLPEFLETFDVADPSLVVGRRSVTTIPSQDLYLMNSPFVVQQTVAMAKHLLENYPESAERIDAAYQLAVTRQPTSTEVNQATGFVANAENAFSNAPDATTMAWASFCQALFVSAEFRYID